MSVRQQMPFGCRWEEFLFQWVVGWCEFCGMPRQWGLGGGELPYERQLFPTLSPVSDASHVRGGGSGYLGSSSSV